MIIELFDKVGTVVRDLEPGLRVFFHHVPSIRVNRNEIKRKKDIKVKWTKDNLKGKLETGIEIY